MNGREVLLAVVSDGAGSAARSDEASQLAVEMFLEEFAPRAEQDPALLTFDRDLIDEWLRRLRHELASRAREAGMAIREFSCTLLAAVAGPESTVCMQVGDGAIVGSGNEVGEYSWLTWPQHGEFANTTNFVVDGDVFETMQFEFIDRPLNELALFSDGIERLVLDMRARAVHSPALRPIFTWLASTLPVDKSEPEPALQKWLASPQVNDRTDDDKTLVMATRVEIKAAQVA
jgi:hypothetical protein